MTTTRQIMRIGTECTDVIDTITATACKMAELGVDALPICGEDRRLRGMVTDRDIVLRCVALGVDTSTVTAAGFVTSSPVAAEADDPIGEALRTMARHGVRWLPVLDGTELIGMVSQADIASALTDDQAGELVAAIAAGRADV